MQAAMCTLGQHNNLRKCREQAMLDKELEQGAALSGPFTQRRAPMEPVELQEGAIRGGC
jgi:hypothetical protein